MGSIAILKRQCKHLLAASPSARAALSHERVIAHCRAAGHRWRDSFWSPPITLLAFLLQVLGGAKTLRAAVADTIAEVAAAGFAVGIPSPDPSAFAQARRRVPEAVFAAVLRDVTERIDTLANARTWHGRRVIIIDGTGVSMPDEPELQRVFPQPGSQKPGCGFPVARMVALFSWSSGAILAHGLCSLHRSEISLLRTLLDAFRPGDVALADRHYCSYVDIARLAGRGVDVVMRMHQARSADFRAGRRLGHDERLVVWRRPPYWKAGFGLSREEFDALPEEMTLRMVRMSNARSGFRTRKIVVVTTVLDPGKAPRSDLLELYRDRWTIELNLRSLKTTLGMDVLRGKSLDVVRKEILMHLLLYNLLRLLIWEAANGRDPRRLSFAGTLHRLRGVAGRFLIGDMSDADRERMMAVIVACVAKDALPTRPGRFEPRRVKRRKKNYSVMIKPRAHYRAHGDPLCR